MKRTIKLTLLILLLLSGQVYASGIVLSSGANAAFEKGAIRLCSQDYDAFYFQQETCFKQQLVSLLTIKIYMGRWHARKQYFLAQGENNDYVWVTMFLSEAVRNSTENINGLPTIDYKRVVTRLRTYLTPWLKRNGYRAEVPTMQLYLQ